MGSSRPLIDDAVRALFPGRTDEEIERFHARAKQLESEQAKTKLLGTDLHLGSIARNLGWDAVKEYLRASVGTDTLDAEDISRISEACGFWYKLEAVELYSALFGSAAEASKKTAKHRDKAIKALSSQVTDYDVDAEA